MFIDTKECKKNASDIVRFVNLRRRVKSSIDCFLELLRTMSHRLAATHHDNQALRPIFEGKASEKASYLGWR